MTIQKESNGSTLILALEGRLDTTTSPQLEKEVSESLENISELIFDLEKLEYISSAGLRVLLASHKAMAGKGKMLLKNVGPNIQEVLDITGFSDILTIE